MTTVHIGPDLELGRALLLGEDGDITRSVRRAARALRGERPGMYRIRVDVIPIVRHLLTEDDVKRFERAAHLAVERRWHPELLVCLRELTDPNADYAVELEAQPDPSARLGAPVGATVVYRTAAHGESRLKTSLWIGPTRFRLVCTESRGVFTARIRAHEAMEVGRQDFGADGMPLTPMRREEEGTTFLAIPTTNARLSRRAFALTWQPSVAKPAWALRTLGRNTVLLANKELSQGEEHVTPLGTSFRIGHSTFHLEEDV